MAGFILHIDDEPGLPEGVAEALERDGYVLRHTADAEEAMGWVAERRPVLVLMEIDLQGCDGLDLLAGIRDPRFGSVPVLVVTQVPRDSGLHGEAIAIGVVDFLTKPVRPQEILSVIREFAPLPPPPPPKPTPAAAKAPPQAARSGSDLSGELSDVPVPELLARLRRRGASGVLAVGSGGVRVGIQLRNGSPVAIQSNGSSAPRVAEALLYESFGWEDGRYRFSSGLRLEPDGTLELGGDPAGLMLTGVLDASPRRQVRERLAKRESLYASITEGSLAALEGEGVGLTRRQRQALSNLGGSDTLSVLLDADVLSTQLVYALWVAGFLELRTAPTLALTELLEQADASAPQLEVDTAHEAPPERERPRPRPRAPERGPSDDREDVSNRLRELAQRVMAADDFETLGVEPSVSDGEVRVAYERVLREIPELSPTGSQIELAQRAARIRDRVEAAYKNLRSEEKRRAYALLRREEELDGDSKPSAERALEGERWFRKGQAHLERRRYTEALEAFGMASHLDPDQGEYVAHLGYALYLSNPNDRVVQREAMEHVASGIKRSPRNAQSYVYLGRILRAKGDVEAAKKIFRKALRIKPDCHPALQELRVLEMRERKGKGVLSRLLKR